MWCILPGRKRAHWFIESPSGTAFLGCCGQTALYLIRQVTIASTGDLVCEQCAIQRAVGKISRRYWSTPEERRDFRRLLREARAKGQIIERVP